MTKKKFEFKDQDLNFIYLREQNAKTKKWENVSLDECSDKKFEAYMAKRFGKGKKFWQDGKEAGKPWCRADKLGLINFVQEHSSTEEPVFCMISRDYRDK